MANPDKWDTDFSEILMKKTLPAIALILFAATLWFLNKKSNTPELEIQKAVDDIRLVSNLPPKRGEPPDDPHAVRILNLGRKAGPSLVEKLSDTSKTQVAYGFQYKVGDVALALLVEIYSPPSWPFPDDSEKIPTKHGSFQDYVEFFEDPGARDRLQESWREYVRHH